MEVADSHMSEHFSAHTLPHSDIDMSGEYYDEEYMMHDATEPTNDTEIEIYDAEIDEQPGHDEVEMDEYTDEIADDETHMGTYVSGDDATATDVTVEDVQLRSSPIASGTPRVTPLRPISPHATIDTDLPINEAPADPPATHSPHSVATLVDDSEIQLVQAEGAKEDSLNEVIDLTEADDQPPDWHVDTIEPTEPETDAPRGELHPVEHEVYDEEDPPATTGSPSLQAVPDQLLGAEEVIVLSDTGASSGVDALGHLEIPEQPEQDSHSPIEEALVINQQVRDDAADSMEPSPPIRLEYKEANLGIDQIFDIFAPSNPNSQDVQLLFHDNRTLYYEPLSSFFMRLRETEYFSGSNWQDAEMELKLELGSLDLSIGEDHRDTDNISLFKLSFIWSGLGIEEPPCFTLIRRPERFAARFARLVEQVEQGDLQNDEIGGSHQVHDEIGTETNNEHGSLAGDGIGIQHEVEEHPEDNDGGDEGNPPVDPHVAEHDGRPHDTHEGEGEGEGEEVTSTAEATENSRKPCQELGVAHHDSQDTETLDSNLNSNHGAQAHDVAPAQGSEQDASSSSTLKTTGTVAGSLELGDSIGESSSHEPPTSFNQTDSGVFQDDEYNEYETETDLAVEGTDLDGASASPSGHAEAGDFDEYEDYEDTEDLPETVGGQLPADTESEGTNGAPPAATEAQPYLPNSDLKRNIDEYDTDPNSPWTENKRTKHT